MTTAADTTRRIASAGFVTVAVGSAANISFLLWLIRSLGASAAGVVVIGIAVQVIILRTTDFGSMAAIVRYLSGSLAAERTMTVQAARRVVLIGIAVTFTLGVLAGAVLWAAAPTVASMLNEEQSGQMTTTLRVVAIAAPLFVVYMNCVHALKGVEAFIKFRLIERLGRPTLYLVTCLGFQVGSPTTTIITLQIINLGLLVAAGLALRSALSVFEAGSDSTLMSVGEFWAFAAPQGVSGLLDGVLAWSDTILVSAMLSSASAAAYTAVSRVVLIHMFSLDAAIEVGAPRFSAAAARNEKGSLQRTYHDLIGFQSSIVWPLAVPLILFLSTLAPLVDPSLEEAVTAGRIILVGAMVAAVFGPAAVLVLMMGRSRLVMVGSGLALAVNLTINVLLLPRWGLSAAGLAWSAALVVSAATAAWFARDVAITGVRAIGQRARWSLVASLAMSLALYALGFAGGRAALGVVAVGGSAVLTLNNLRSYRRPQTNDLQGTHA